MTGEASDRSPNGLRVLVDRLVGSTTDGSTVGLRVDAGDLDEAEARYLYYLGMVGLLLDRWIDARPSTVDDLPAASRRLQAAEGPIRFALAERSSRTWERETIARARTISNGMDEAWLIPTLRRDIEVYRQRAEALRVAIEAAR